jgi:hypothetical protein
MSTRREFLGHLASTAIASRVLLAGGAIGEAMFLEGCDLETDIENWIPLGEDAVTAIEAVLSANGIVIAPALSAIVTTIENGFTALQGAITEYKSTNPPPVGALAKIETALNDVLQNFGQFTSGLSGVAAKVLTLVVDLADVVISTIQGFENRLGSGSQSAAARTSILAAKVNVAGQTKVVTPTKRSKGKFRSDWNKLLDGAKSSVTVPKNAYL